MLCALAAAHCPAQQTVYEPDFRQTIADTWPNQIDPTNAQRDWGWKHDYDIEALVDFMLAGVAARK